MDLRKFVESALVDVCAGIEAAQANEKFGGRIAPSGTGGHDFSPNQGVHSQARILSTVIQFDVAVSVQNRAGAKASGKTGIFVVEARGDLDIERTAETVSRLKFSVPLVFKPNSKTWHDD